jgi:hypothetical protein
MPISGFKTGDRVTTPGGRRALVVGVKRDGTERVLVELFGHTQTFSSGHNRKTFDAAALRKGW